MDLGHVAPVCERETAPARLSGKCLGSPLRGPASAEGRLRGGVTLRLWTCDPRYMAWEEVTMETVDDSRYMAWVVGLPWTVDM